MKKNKIINLDERIKKVKLEKDLAEIKLDLDMIERHTKKDMTKSTKKDIIEFMNIRKEVGAIFENWRYDNIIKTEEKLAFWSYITEVYKNLLMPSIEDFNLGDGDVLEKLNQALAMAGALEGFHMRCMRTYLNRGRGED